MRVEQFVLNDARNVVLTAYIQETGGTYQKLLRRPGILVIPGGAYRYVSRREGDPVASCFLQAGYQVMILEYSVGEFAAWPNPLEDYEQAMECISAHAEEWHLVMERFAVIGFSAGGHLAGAAATMAKHRPAAAILGCGVLCYCIQALFGISQVITTPFFWVALALLVSSCNTSRPQTADVGEG